MKKLKPSDYRFFSIALIVCICFVALVFVGNIGMCIQDIIKSDYFLTIGDALLREWVTLSASFIALLFFITLKVLFHKRYTK